MPGTASGDKIEAGKPERRFRRRGREENREAILARGMRQTKSGTMIRQIHSARNCNRILLLSTELACNAGSPGL
jgi:hypothetical protein